MPKTDLRPTQSVTDVTRRAIVDSLILEDISWAGDVDEVEFLNRMFDLKAWPSTDGRNATNHRPSKRFREPKSS